MFDPEIHLPLIILAFRISIRQTSHLLLKTRTIRFFVEQRSKIADGWVVPLIKLKRVISVS